MHSRASLFNPFDALKGLNEELRKKEKVTIVRKQLSVDDCDELNYLIHELQCGMMVTIIYYHIDHYEQVEGMISKIDLEYKKIITIVKKEIYIPDIIKITKG